MEATSQTATVQAPKPQRIRSLTRLPRRPSTRATKPDIPGLEPTTANAGRHLRVRLQFTSRRWPRRLRRPRRPIHGKRRSRRSAQSLNTSSPSQAQAQSSAYQTPTPQAIHPASWGSMAPSVAPTYSPQVSTQGYSEALTRWSSWWTGQSSTVAKSGSGRVSKSSKRRKS